MPSFKRLFALACTAAAAACSADTITGRHPVGPNFTITTGSTTCPDTVSVGQTAQCVAYFYDENHNLVSNTTPTWSSTNTSILTVNSSGQVTGVAVGSASAQATYAGVTGSKSVYVKRGLTVTILGPTLAPRWVTCSWTSAVSGGTAPYSYQWSDAHGTGSQADTNESYYVDMISASDDIYLTVTDANGVQKSASKHVNTSLSAPPC
jgi:hypothetical protein